MRKNFKLLFRCLRVWTLILIIHSTPSLAEFQLSVAEKNGLPIVQNGGAQVLSSEYIFWDKNWKWAGQKMKFSSNAQFDYETTGYNKKLDFKLETKVKKVHENTINWSFEFDVKNTKQDIIGGGIAFNFGSANPELGVREPVLFPNNQGWKISTLAGGEIEVRFTPNLPLIKFEKGGKKKIRAFFHRGDIVQGKHKFDMTITLRGDFKLKPTIGERFQIEMASQWPKGIIDWQTFPIDLSFLNQNEKPAGKHGFIKSHEDMLVFEDGTVGRFWGRISRQRPCFKPQKLI